MVIFDPKMVIFDPKMVIFDPKMVKKKNSRMHRLLTHRGIPPTRGAAIPSKAHWVVGVLRGPFYEQFSSCQLPQVIFFLLEK